MIVKTKLQDVNWFYDLDLGDILCVQQDSDYQIFETKKGPLRIYSTMEATPELFPDLTRVHRSCLVNIRQLQGFAPISDDQSVMLLFKDGSIRRTGRSRTYYDDFVSKFHAYANELW